MGDESRTVTVTVPAEAAEEFERLAQAEGRSQSDLFPELVRVYRTRLRRDRLRELQEYGASRARELGITEDDVERLIEEARRERRGQSAP